MEFLLCQGAGRGDLPSACPRLCCGPLRAGWAVAVLQFELEGATTAGLAGVAVDDLMGPPDCPAGLAMGMALVLALQLGSLLVCREAWSA